MNKKLTQTVICLIALIITSPAILFGDDKTAPVIPGMKSAGQFEKTPLVFIENKGQVTDENGNLRSDIDFKVTAQGLNIFVQPGRIHYQWSKPHSADKDDMSIDIYRMDVELVGANTNAHATKEARDDYYEQYYGKPGFPDGIMAETYRKVTYKNIYPNIDWVLYNTDGHLKYDFIVHPGGNPQDIKFKYNGSDNVEITPDGDIVAHTPYGSITEEKPYSYNPDTKEVIASSAVFASNGQLQFNLADYTGTVVIDPEIEWCTYYGGPDQEAGYTVVTDTSGGAYLGGYTTSSLNVAISGHQTTYGGSRDAFVVRFSKTCSRLWATYYGGTGDDFFFASTIDTLGFTYFAGITKTTSGMASIGAHQTVYGGGNSDVLLVKLNPTGSRIWATYYGGTGDESENQFEYQASVACDKNNNIYLAGNTTSTTLGEIATSGTHQSVYSGSRDGFLARFNINGVRQWGTYYGGTDFDRVAKIVFDQVNNVYISGDTKSTGTAIATNGSHQSSNGGNGDAFLAKFFPNGQRRWGTFYGGLDADGNEGLAADVYGYIYMSGSTSSTSGIATSGSSQTTFGGQQDCFLVKFDTAGTRQWGTYYGGQFTDHCGDMTMDNFGNICFTGSTGSPSGIATPGAYQTSHGGIGSFDAFLAIFTLGGVKYWASYFGSDQFDYGYGLKYSNRGDLYLAGVTASTNNIATGSSSGAFQINLSGTLDGFLAKFKADTSTFILQPFNVNNICAGDSFYISYGITNPFRIGNKFYVQLSNASGSFANPDTIGSLTSSDVGTILCVIPKSTPGGTGYKVRIVSSLPLSTSLESINPMTIKTLPVKPTAGSNTPVCSQGAALNLTATTTTPGVSYDWVGPDNFSSNLQNPSISTPPLTASGNYIVTASLNGCATKDTESVVVNITPVITSVTSNSPVCEGGNLQLNVATSTPGVTFDWKGPDNMTDNVQSPTVTNIKTSGSGYYVVIISRISCFDKDSVMVQVNPTFTPLIASTQVSPDDTICLGDTLSFTSAASGGGPSPTYQWQINGTDIPAATTNSLIYAGFANNDAVRLVYKGSGPCLTKPADTSVPIVITVQSAIIPSVGIEVQPGVIAPENTLLLFTATDTNGGPAPTFQWYKNGTPIPGAISDVLPQYTTTDLVTGDQVCVLLTSSLSCAEPDTASKCADLIDVVGVKNISPLARLSLFPNPNNGNFSLEGIVNFNKEIRIDIINALGQVVYHDSILPVNNEVRKDITLEQQLINGIYLLRLVMDDETEVKRFTLSK